MTSNTWKVVCFSLIFYKIMKSQASVNTFLTVTEAMHKFYLTPSTYIVFDRQSHDFENERFLLEIIKSHSRRDIMSQAITFKDLKLLSDRQENTLYSLLIHDRENLKDAINVTKNIDMSIHPWLLYINKTAQFDCDKPDENFFKLRMDTRMAVMCEGNTILKSYHEILDNQIEVVDLAIWSPEKMKLEFKNDRSLIRAHMNLKGITLKVASKVNRSILSNDIDATIAHFNFELMDEVANLSNFKTEVVAINNELGYLDYKTNKWFGMMKQMDDKVADIGLAFFTLSHKRLRAVDYAIPLAKGRCLLYAKLPEDIEVLWTTYFKVFTKYAWLAIGMSIFIFSCVLYFMKMRHRTISTPSFSEYFINIWGIFSMQSPSETPTSIPMKIVYFSILFLSLILNAVYSASITSYIAVLSTELPFSNYDEFLRDNSYDLIVIKGSRDHSFILSNNSRLTPLQGRLKESSLLPIHAYEGFKQACKEKTAFYTDEVTYDSMRNSPPCKLGAVNMELIEYMSFVMTKNSPYKKTIDYNILRLMDYGILNRLREKHFQKYIELPNVQANVITLKEIWSIIIIWTVGFFITLVGLLVEIIVFKLSSTRRTKHSLFRCAIVNRGKKQLRKNKMYFGSKLNV